MSYKHGDLVYFKKAKKSVRNHAPEVLFKGHGIGIFLGALPPFCADLKPIDLFRLLGPCGLLTFDDVVDFLGEEAGKECIKKYEEKYYKVEEVVPHDGPLPIKSSLVDVKGKPLDMSLTENIEVETEIN